MIKINLLAGERKVARKRAVFDVTQQITVVCALIMLLAVAVIGWRWWSISHDERQMDDAISSAQQETQRLHGVIAQVQQFEQRKAQLQQRVTLIEQLRKDQVGPVHMLDQISLALPDSLWLSELKQNAATNEVVIDGKSLSLTGLSDFVGNLERSGYFQKSVEIVSSTTETGTAGQPGEVIKFEIKAVFKRPGDASAAPAAGAAGQLKPTS